MYEQFKRSRENNGIDFSINRVFLTFRDSGLEKKFKQSYFQSNLQMGRALHLVAVFFYCLVALWDAVVIDPSRSTTWLWVVSAVTLTFLSGLASSYFLKNFYEKYWQPLFAFYVLTTGIGFSVVTAASSPVYPVYNFMGIIFCLFFCYTFIRLTFSWAVAAGNAIVFIYTFGSWFFVGPPAKVLLTAFFYMFGINLLGMMVCYTLELMSRRDFMLNYLLRISESKTKDMNARLEMIAIDRTKKLSRTNQELETAIQREKELVAELKNEEEILVKSLNSLQQAEAIARLGYFERNWQTGEGYWSHGFYKLLGYTTSSETLTHEAFLSFIHEDDRQRVTDHIQRSVADHEPMDIEFRLIHQDGTIIQVHGIADNFYDDQDRPLMTKGTFQDITDRKQAEGEFQNLEKRLNQAQKMESIGTLAGGIAHDFNNILSSIIGFTELSLEDVEKNSFIEDNLQEVYAAGKRAKDLVSQILTFARQSDEELRPVQVRLIAKEVAKFIRSSIPATIEIHQNIESEALIMGDSTQVHQILMNLCTNAAHAMEDGGGILGISLKEVVIDSDNHLKAIDLTPGKYLALTVSDTGAGIPREIIDKIFEPYFTTKGLGEGTGMGLAMVHGIVENYGGKITVESTPGQGTSFAIYLPVIKKRSEHQAYASEDLSIGTERILFVDDELPIAKMGSQVLERLGYHVTVRTSSIEAVELFCAKPDDFDLVISDVTMPNMTGDKLAIEMMKIRPDIPVILCTGYSKRISDESAAHIGIKAFAHKPIVRSELAKTVREVLDGRK
jgi:PAS domain S-box-containing protein